MARYKCNYITSRSLAHAHLIIANRTISRTRDWSCWWIDRSIKWWIMINCIVIRHPSGTPCSPLDNHCVGPCTYRESSLGMSDACIYINYWPKSKSVTLIRWPSDAATTRVHPVDDGPPCNVPETATGGPSTYPDGSGSGSLLTPWQLWASVVSTASVNNERVRSHNQIWLFTEWVQFSKDKQTINGNTSQYGDLLLRRR